MRCRRLAAGILVGVLALGPVGTAAAAPNVVQTNYDCILAGEAWQVTTGITPPGPFASGRLFVRTAASPDYYYANVERDGVVRLPGPLPEARYVSYYTELTLADGTSLRSNANTANVVRDHASCAGSMAPTTSAGGPMFSLGGAPVSAPGFVSSATAGMGGEILPALAPSSHGGGSFFGSQSFLVGLGALTTGVVAGVVLSDEDDKPASPSR